MSHVVAIMKRTVSTSGNLDKRAPLELITGETPNVSEYLDFGFYDRVRFREHVGVGPTKLAGWLGVSNTVDSLMSIWILAESEIQDPVPQFRL